MKNLTKLVDMLYNAISTQTVFKAKSLGTIGADTIMVCIGKEYYEITVKHLVDKKEG